MTTVPKCSGCLKTIRGKIFLDSNRKKLGKKSTSVVDYYCEGCFEKINYERSLDNEHSNKEKNNKRPSGKRVRR